ncbi:MAG: hypothetical protein ACE5MG_03465, partial [Candidatus Methylomirabilales bacterium]
MREQQKALIVLHGYGIALVGHRILVVEQRRSSSAFSCSSPEGGRAVRLGSPQAVRLGSPQAVRLGSPQAVR